MPRGRCGRARPPGTAGHGDEPSTLLGFLDYQRATLAWKCRGLDSVGLSTTVGASSMTLGGLLKHMALVEQWWFSQSLHGRHREPPWDSVDWKADPDWEWHSAPRPVRPGGPVVRISPSPVTLASCAGSASRDDRIIQRR